MFLEPILQSCVTVSDSKDQPKLQFPCRNIFHCKTVLLVTFHRKIYLKARIEMNHFHPAHKTKYISKRNFSSENIKKKLIYNYHKVLGYLQIYMYYHFVYTCII